MATTSMNFTLSSTLLGNITKGGSGNGAYVFAFAFDGAGKLLRSSTLIDNGVKAATSLQLADNSTVTGGNVIVVTQQVGKGKTSTLPGTVKAIGDLVNTDKAKQLNYRYDAIEFTLLNAGSDVADLTNIVQFGAPMSLSVTYSSGKTETRGYAVSGQTIVNDLKALSPAGTQNYPWAAGGPLTGQRETLGLANNVVPNPLNVASDWKTYVTGFGGIAGSAYLSAYFNDTGTLSFYKVVYDKPNQVFWLNPVKLGSGVPTTANSVKIPFADLTQNIYTQAGSLSVYTGMNGTLVETFSTFTPNNAWGQITRSLVAGFDAGLWGGSAHSINPMVSGKIDLNQTWNWSAPYTYQAITAPSGAKKFGYTNSIGLGTGTVGDPNRKMYYDPFAAEFVKSSNAYGYSYSDLLSEGGGVNPSLSIFDPGTNSNVARIDVKLFDLGETPTGYTKPSFAYVPPTGATYKPASTKSTDQFLFDFSLGKYFPVPGVPITFRFYAPGDSQARNGFVSFSLPTGTTQGKDYEQSFTVGGGPGKWTLTANGYSGAPGFLLMSGVPVTSDGSTGWYQMVIGSGSLAKTYNMYVQSSPSSPTNRITSAVVDGGALAQQIPNQPNQVKFSFDPAGSITYSPFYFSAAKALVGNAGPDRLVSGAGADMLVGGAGDDIHKVNDADDQVVEVAGEGYDTVYAKVDYTLGAGQWIEVLRGNAGTTGLTLGGNEYRNRIVGGPGDDRLNGGGGPDKLYGMAGNDRLDGGTRADYMAGGTGDDVYIVDNPGDQVVEVADEGYDTVYARVDHTLAAGQWIEVLRANATGLTLSGNEFRNRIVGGAGDDTLNGGGGPDKLFGGAGNDRLDGGTRADYMAGGSGDDVYIVDDPGDQVVEIAGEGRDTVYARIDYALAAGQEIEVLRAAGAAGLDLRGNAFDNRLVGGAGDDTLDGGAGHDRLDGGDGNDTISTTGARATILGGNGDDAIRLDGSATSAGSVDGGAGDDTVYSADLGQFVVSNVETLDTYYGYVNGSVAQFASFDHYVAGLADPDMQIAFSLRGAGGTLDFTTAIGGQNSVQIRDAGLTSGVVVTGSVNGDEMLGSDFNDSFRGGGGADSLYGGNGADTLRGGSGNDLLDGGAGNDRLVGGSGNDIFRFDTALAADNVDAIADFAAGDTMELDRTVFAGLALGQLGASAFALDSATGAGPQVVYEQATGALFFDSNGAVAGGATRFASLSGATGLDASDFKVI